MSQVKMSIHQEAPQVRFICQQTQNTISTDAGMSTVLTKGHGQYAPMPPVLGPSSPSLSRLWSWAGGRQDTVAPSVNAKHWKEITEKMSTFLSTQPKTHCTVPLHHVSTHNHCTMEKKTPQKYMGCGLALHCGSTWFHL